MIRQFLIFAVIGTTIILGASANIINSKLTLQLAKNGKANIVVSFKSDSSSVMEKAGNMRFSSRGARAKFIKAELEKMKVSSQGNVMQQLLSSRSLSVSASPLRIHSSWATNRVYIKDATSGIVEVLSSHPNVTEIREEIVASIASPISSNNGVSEKEAPWNIEKVGASSVWNLGVNGTGVVIAILDSGIRGTHERLRGTKRSIYDWFDPVHNTQAPTDHQGHGTHVAGTIIGSGGIGAAPGAEWMGCAACNEQGSCPESALISCGEWVACPTLPDGSSENCDLVPHITSNSWGYAYYDGGVRFYDELIRIHTEIGIMSVFAAGNERNCKSIRYPSDHEEVITVGATDINDQLTFFSSRGPTINNLVKPNVAAPGYDILSASHISDTDLKLGSGTSEACPLVSGVVALILSKNPNLNFSQVKNLVFETAMKNIVPVTACGDTPPTVWPNNMYGNGRIDALKAIEKISNVE